MKAPQETPGEHRLLVKQIGPGVWVLRDTKGNRVLSSKDFPTPADAVDAAHAIHVLGELLSVKR